MPAASGAQPVEATVVRRTVTSGNSASNLASGRERWRFEHLLLDGAPDRRDHRCSKRTRVLTFARLALDSDIPLRHILIEITVRSIRDEQAWLRGYWHQLVERRHPVPRKPLPIGLGRSPLAC